MKKIRPVLLLGGWALVAAACGHKGPVMAPLTREPMRIDSLMASQQGGRILLKWTAPGVHVDGRPLPSSAAYEIWLLRNNAAEAALDRDTAADQSWTRAFRLAVLDIYGRQYVENAPPPIPPEAANRAASASSLARPS